jgi:hypothetical protein
MSLTLCTYAALISFDSDCRSGISNLATTIYRATVKVIVPAWRPFPISSWHDKLSYAVKLHLNASIQGSCLLSGQTQYPGVSTRLEKRGLPLYIEDLESFNFDPDDINLQYYQELCLLPRGIGLDSSKSGELLISALESHRDWVRDSCHMPKKIPYRYWGSYLPKWVSEPWCVVKTDSHCYHSHTMVSYKEMQTRTSLIPLHVLTSQVLTLSINTELYLLKFSISS